MQTNMDEISRRSFLSSAAGATALTAVPNVTANRRSFDEIYQQALHIREKTGKREKFLKYLNKHTNVVSTAHREFQVPVGSSEDVSTQEIPKSNITTDMTLLYELDCPDGDSYGYVDYEFSVDSPYSYGEKGADHISLGWNGDHYKVIDYEWYSSDDSPNLSYNDSNLNGVDWEWIDDTACGAGCNIDNKYVGTKVQLLNTDQERSIRGEWRHTWSDTSYNGFGVSSGGGIVFNTEPTENYWEGKYETREDSQADYFQC